MSSKTKSVTAVLIVLALVAGVGMTKVGSKYKTQDKVNLIFANATSNSAKKAGEKFKELVEEYSDGDITVDLFPDNQLGDDKTVACLLYTSNVSILFCKGDFLFPMPCTKSIFSSCFNAYSFLRNRFTCFILTVSP